MLPHSIFPLMFVLTVSGSELCKRHEVIQGCIVDNGHAQCEAWDLAASIQGLPTCTTRITYSLLTDPQYINVTRFKWIELQYINFSRLTGLQELSISTNYKNYSHIRISMDSPTMVNIMPNIKVLRLKVLRNWEDMTDENEGMYKRMKHLEVLEFTRAQRLGLSVASHVIGQEPSMKTLILRNIQEIGHAKTYNPFLDLTRFVCGGNVMSLDLSYNDIAYINISNGCWNTKIRYLNLNHNILTSSIQIRERLWVGLSSMFARIETVIGSSICPGDKYQEGLWDDDYNIPEYHDNGDINLSPLSKLFLHSPLSSFARYDFWLKDIMHHCGNFSVTDVTQCVLQESKDLCELTQCLSPDKDFTQCTSDTSSSQVQYFAKHMCSYKPCAYNIPIPLPPQLKSFSMHNLGSFGHITTKTPNPDTIKTLCIHPHNNLEVIDIPNIKVSSKQVFPGFLHLSGLQKLKYVNIQGYKLPFLISQVILHDTDSIVELHIGGSKITENDILSANLLQNFIQLTLLNLSSASLLGIEDDAFINHRHLSVLDLSYNQLNSSSLKSIDLSQTSMKSLNLSHNHLTSIPALMRHQLDKMKGLELYLSGNTFICNCENLEFLQWIQQSSSSITFHYAGDHVCADSPGDTIHNIVIDSLYCDWYWKQPVIAVGSSFAFSLFFVMVFGIYKKRWFISNLIFRFQERFCMASDDNSAGPFKYDAFIVYSSVDEDRLWVHYKLVDKLETEYGFRLCVEHRDFLGGVDKLDNIEKAIHSSRKVLVVLSENLLQDPWCVDSVQMTLNADHNKLIVIMYKDVLLSGVSRVIQIMMENKRSISWNEKPAAAQKLFWKELTRALYSKKGTADDARISEWSQEQSLLI